MNKLICLSVLLLCLTYPSTILCALKWQLVNVNGSSPTPRYHHALATTGSVAIIVGGFTFDNSNFSKSYFLDDTWSFNTTNSSWSSVAATGLVPRAYFTANAYNATNNTTQVVVFAGTSTNNTALGDVKRLNTNNNTATWSNDTYANITNAGNLLLRQFHASVIINDTLYVMGGHVYGINKSGNDLVAYNITAKTWKVLKNDSSVAAPAPRQGHTMLSFADPVWGASLLVFGGYSDVPATPGYNDVWQYILETGKWHQLNLKNSPPGRYSHSAAIFDDKSMIVFGGMSTAWNGTNPSVDTYYGDTWSLQLMGGGHAAWTRLLEDSPAGIGRRQGHTMAVINGNIYSFFGYQQYVGLTNQVWVLVAQ